VPVDLQKLKNASRLDLLQKLKEITDKKKNQLIWKYYVTVDNMLENPCSKLYNTASRQYWDQSCLWIGFAYFIVVASYFLVNKIWFKCWLKTTLPILKYVIMQINNIFHIHLGSSTSCKLCLVTCTYGTCIQTTSSTSITVAIQSTSLDHHENSLMVP